MSWMVYKIVFRLLTPLHVGAGQMGNVQRARPYLTGKSLWGVLTARLTRDYSELGGDYVAIGRRVNDELAFSYFYPTISETVDLWPWDDPDRFAWRYLGSYASTALDYSRNAAEEGSLHETEFIAPITRDGQPVYLVGYIFEQEGCALPWRQVLDRLQVGGERNYGWGRLALKAILPGDAKLFEHHAIEVKTDRPSLKVGVNVPLLAHTVAKMDGSLFASGRLGPLVGRETVNPNAYGQSLALTAICWEPGSTINQSSSMFIHEYGIWRTTALMP